MLTIKVKKNYNIDDAIDFIFHGNQSDLSGHGSDEQKKNMRLKMQYKTTLPMANQLMLQNLTMTFLLLP